MEYKAQQSILSQLSARFNLMVCLVFGLLVANILLSIFIYLVWRHHSVEITPFSGSPSYIKSDVAVDSHYLSLMTENFINERLNVSPETIAANHKRLLSFIHPKVYPYFLKQLKLEAKLILDKKMSSNFAIQSVAVNATDLSAQVTGRLKRYVGIQQIDEVQKNYNLQFHYAHGRLTIIKFVAVKEKKDV